MEVGLERVSDGFLAKRKEIMPPIEWLFPYRGHSHLAPSPNKISETFHNKTRYYRIQVASINRNPAADRNSPPGSDFACHLDRMAFQFDIHPKGENHVMG